MGSVRSVGLVGARGHTGAELVRLLSGHPSLRLAFVGSRELAGEPVPGVSGLRYTSPTPRQAAESGADAIVLALPNDRSPEWVSAIDAQRADTVIVDLSADHRFSEGWTYGLPEHFRDSIRGRRRIANPGCYATAMQLLLRPLADLFEGPVQCFGVSGYSGAGTTPSDRNDPDKLRDNLVPYHLVGHVHEREVTRHLGHPVEFLPHVAPHFRGLTITANAHTRAPVTAAEVWERWRAAYAQEPLVTLVEAAPWVSAIAGRHHAELGGVTVSADGRRLVVVGTLDNLLKGAATQAVQNLNLALGSPELAGIPT